MLLQHRINNIELRPYSPDPDNQWEIIKWYPNPYLESMDDFPTICNTSTNLFKTIKEFCVVIAFVDLKDETYTVRIVDKRDKYLQREYKDDFQDYLTILSEIPPPKDTIVSESETNHSK